MRYRVLESSIAKVTLSGHVAIVGRLVVHVIESPHEMDFNAAELGFEDGKISPWMVRFVRRGDSPEVVPFKPKRLGSAHDLEMEEIRGHDASVPDEGSTVEIGRSLAEIHHQSGGESHASVFGEEKRPPLDG